MVCIPPISFCVDIHILFLFKTYEDSLKTVLVIGCGIAGPVVAIHLIQSGWKPIIFDKSKGNDDVGMSMTIAPNGLRALHTYESEGVIVQARARIRVELCVYVWRGMTRMLVLILKLCVC